VIARLTGTVLERTTTAVVVDVAGVGYLVQVTAGVELPARGEQVSLHTSLQVREDSMTLYGFTSAAQLALFELLLTSSGVGPRLALAALSTHRPEVLRTAIAGSDEATLTAVPGIGRKVAQRLVLELKEKVGSVAGLPATDPSTAQPGTSGVAMAVEEEVRDALLGLGYSSAEVTAALRATDEVPGEAAARLRAALRHLGGTAS